HPRRRRRRYCLVPGPTSLGDVSVGTSTATVRTTPALAETASLTMLVGSQGAVHLTAPRSGPAHRRPSCCHRPPKLIESVQNLPRVCRWHLGRGYQAVGASRGGSRRHGPRPARAQARGMPRGKRPLGLPTVERVVFGAAGAPICPCSTRRSKPAAT